MSDTKILLLANSQISAIYEQYWLVILLYVREQIHLQEDAEEVLLEVFLAALESEIFFHLAER